MATHTPIPESYTGPGLVDLQLNGYAGFDFNSPAGTWAQANFHRVQVALAKRGVVVALPTFITDDADALVARAENYARFLHTDASLAQTFPLLHIEGPFISPNEGPRGAHPLGYCRTPEALPDLLDRLIEASGNRVGILTLAPELPGALDLIREATSKGIRIALGHTNADSETIRLAIEAGATLSTHLGNGSHQTLPRLDNYVQRQLANDQLHATFIADGHHMPFPTLQNFLRAKTFERSILITDAISATEMGQGRYMLGSETVEVSKTNRVSKPGQQNLAGSVLTLDRAILNATERCGIPFETTWKMASSNPASYMGLPTPKDVSVTITDKGFKKQ